MPGHSLGINGLSVATVNNVDGLGLILILISFLSFPQNKKIIKNGLLAPLFDFFNNKPVLVFYMI